MKYQLQDQFQVDMDVIRMHLWKVKASHSVPSTRAYWSRWAGNDLGMNAQVVLRVVRTYLSTEKYRRHRHVAKMTMTDAGIELVSTYVGSW